MLAKEGHIEEAVWRCVGLEATVSLPELVRGADGKERRIARFHVGSGVGIRWGICTIETDPSGIPIARLWVPPEHRWISRFDSGAFNVRRAGEAAASSFFDADWAPVSPEQICSGV